MPFRLSNAPASFQGYINKILAEKLDILIYTEDLGQGHVKAVSVDFIRTKFVFWATSCRPRQIRMEDERIKAVKNWPKPTSIRDI